MGWSAPTTAAPHLPWLPPPCPSGTDPSASRDPRLLQPDSPAAQSHSLARCCPYRSHPMKGGTSVESAIHHRVMVAEHPVLGCQKADLPKVRLRLGRGPPLPVTSALVCLYPYPRQHPPRRVRLPLGVALALIELASEPVYLCHLLILHRRAMSIGLEVSVQAKVVAAASPWPGPQRHLHLLALLRPGQSLRERRPAPCRRLQVCLAESPILPLDA